jgi:hypothetical protein
MHASKRHLRIYQFDDYGTEIDPAPFSTAYMPATRMPFNRRLRASDYCSLTHQLRQQLAVHLALREAKRKKPLYWGVFVVVCPDRSRAAYRSKRAKTPGLQARLVPGNAYLGSYAAISPLGKIVAGDVMAPRLRQAVAEAEGMIREVMMRKPGEHDKRFLLSRR